MAEKQLNVYQKLIKARKMFIEGGVSKSGKNMAIAFKYFELEDIVPTATQIFDEIGLVTIVNYSPEVATMDVYNTEKPDEKITFTSPMRFTETNKGVNPIQALGASHTYLRRYLYMMVLDICEADEIDATSGVEQPVKAEKPTQKADKPVHKVNNTPKAKTPVTATERKEIKDAVVGADEQANEMQITALRKVLSQFVALDPANEEFVQKIALKTNAFTDISKSDCENLIGKVKEMIKKYKGGAEE